MENQKQISKWSAPVFVMLFSVLIAGVVWINTRSSGQMTKGEDKCGVIARERIYPFSAGILKKFILFQNGEHLEVSVRGPQPAEGNEAVLKDKLLVAEPYDTIYYREWSDGRTEVTDVCLKKH